MMLQYLGISVDVRVVGLVLLNVYDRFFLYVLKMNDRMHLGEIEELESLFPLFILNLIQLFSYTINQSLTWL